MISIYGARITYEDETIYTVFPLGADENEMPQDFNSYEEAVNYAKDNYDEYRIESPN